tara:strand:- start:997 stop:1194 length:198 start_codon:yes stop_codon:yes gene_type:complete
MVNITKMNKLVIDLDEVESIEWEENLNGEDAYTIRFHMKSGKMYTRILLEPQFNQLVSTYKERDD